MRRITKATSISIVVLSALLISHSVVVARKTAARASATRPTVGVASSTDHRDNPLLGTLAQAGPGYRPLRISEIDGHLYVIFTSENENDDATQKGESRGYLDVFDAQGNRVRRYSAIEHSDSWWELNEYVPVPPDAFALASRKIGSSAR